jgi:tryptophan-rich sensory protein
VFAPVWTTLYVLIGIAGWRVWRTPPSAARTRTLQLWAAQLVLNAIWSPLFFGAHQMTWALVEIVVLWVAIVATLLSAWRVDRPAGALLVPYLAWVTFATVLNAGFVALN